MANYCKVSIEDQIAITAIIHQLEAHLIERGCDGMSSARKVARHNLENLFLLNQLSIAGSC